MDIEIWGVTVQKKSYLKTWEQEILRKTYGPIKIKMAGESELMTDRLDTEHQISIQQKE